MKRQPVIWGIILVLLLSSLSSTVIGFNAKKVDMSMQSVEGPMDSAWPMKCHDARHTGRSPYSTADNNGVVLWKYRTTYWIESGPIISNDNIIYFCDKGNIYALFENGSLKWKYYIGDIIWSTPALDENGVLYIGTYDDFLYAINSDGTLLWKFWAGTTASISSSPVIGIDGTIYFGAMGPNDISETGRIYAVNPNGTEKWHYSTDFWIVSDPAIGDDGTIYIGSGDTYFYALNSDGSLKWRYKTGDVIKSHPSIADDGTIYFDSFDGFLYALYPNGTLRWKINAGGSNVASTSIAEDGTLYKGGDKYLYSYYPNGTQKWIFYLGNSETYVGHSSPAISSEGIIYIGTHIGVNSGGDIIAINPDGTELWRRRIANYWIESSPCIDSNGVIYIGTSDEGFGDSYGYLYAIGEGNNPPNKPTINGPSSGKAGNTYNYTIVSTDPDGDNITYSIDWGLGLLLAYGPYESGEEVTLNHTWIERGDYIILVKARDQYGGESEWATLEVSMPIYKNIFHLIFPRFLNFNFCF